MIGRMGTRKVCSLEMLSTELEDLQRAQSTAVEEHEKIMRTHRLQIAELAFKISKQENEVEKARHLEEKAEVTTNFKTWGLPLLRESIMSCVCRSLSLGLFICRNMLWFHVQAQKILALVKEQLDLQEAQETKQVELIEKHKEERVLLQEQCAKLQASLRRECGSKLEPEREAAKKIAELEERLNELEEDTDEKNDIINTLAMSHRQAADEVGDVKTAILNSDVSDGSVT